MTKKDRATVRVEDLAFSYTLSINALAELLDEKGVSCRSRKCWGGSKSWGGKRKGLLNGSS